VLYKILSYNLYQNLPKGNEISSRNFGRTTFSLVQTFRDSAIYPPKLQRRWTKLFPLLKSPKYKVLTGYFSTVIWNKLINSKSVVHFQSVLHLEKTPHLERLPLDFLQHISGCNRFLHLFIIRKYGFITVSVYHANETQRLILTGLELVHDFR